MERRMGKAQPCPLWGRVTGAKVAVIASLALAAATLLAGRFSAGAEAATQVLARGKDVYQRKCAVCHGTEGKGDGPVAAALNPKPRDFTDKAYMAQLDDQYLFKIISKGGAAVGKSPLMPPAALQEQDIWNVIAYIKSLAGR